MTDEAKQFLNILNLKSQLINFDENKLKEMYKDNYENYVLFLNAVGMLINNEMPFLLLNNEEYIDKILTVAQTHRFSTEDNEVKDLVNQIIIACNEIIRLPEGDKYAYRYDYIVNQEDLRDVGFYEEEDLIYALNFDSFLVHVLKDSDMEYLYACDNDQALMSLNYIYNMCPSFFDDETIMNNTIEKLDYMTSEFSKERFNRRRTLSIYADDLGKKIKKIVRGKE